MKDDYLWDKSGEPDPEVQQLEEILGALRYQPRELEIPAHVRPQRRSYLMRGLAIAAAVALLVLGLGVWRNSRAPQPRPLAEVQPPKVEASPAVVIRDTSAGKVEQSVSLSSDTATAPLRTLRHRPVSSVARNRNLSTRSSQLSARELAEVKAAKDQLILALRVASSKLSQVQKRTQGTNEIHNQHKTG